MARTTYDGRGITELRAWARDLGIKGRSKMDGHQLSAACKAARLAQIVAAENALLASVDVKVGTILRHVSSGYVIRVTSDVQVWEQYGTRYVAAEYVELDGWGDHRRAERAAYQNREDARRIERGEAARHPLWQYEAFKLT